MKFEWAYGNYKCLIRPVPVEGIDRQQLEELAAAEASRASAAGKKATAARRCIAEPDHIIEHRLLESCPGCAGSLRATRASGHESRQVFDLQLTLLQFSLLLRWSCWTVRLTVESSNSGRSFASLASR